MHTYRVMPCHPDGLQPLWRDHHATPGMLCNGYEQLLLPETVNTNQDPMCRDVSTDEPQDLSLCLLPVREREEAVKWDQVRLMGCDWVRNRKWKQGRFQGHLEGKSYWGLQ